MGCSPDKCCVPLPIADRPVTRGVTAELQQARAETGAAQRTPGEAHRATYGCSYAIETSAGDAGCGCQVVVAPVLDIEGCFGDAELCGAAFFGRSPDHQSEKDVRK